MKIFLFDKKKKRKEEDVCVKKRRADGRRGGREEEKKRRRKEGKWETKKRVKAARATFFFRGVEGPALGPIRHARLAASTGLVSSRVLQPYDRNGGRGRGGRLGMIDCM